MRIIDADEVIYLIDGETKVETNSKEKAFNDALEVAIQIIDTQKTVGAIPIEWIKDKMDELEGTGRFELSEYLVELLADWEKENEID